ncbi:ABC transporter permease [Streptobacillus moniliformis]|uniref:ABC transporter permease n=1 Tax=Streptobacillus moniliformis TaxID=34105 RepID=UPI0007EEAAB3|nr:ABC transporter permease [Streptobacillus moniliformis]
MKKIIDILIRYYLIFLLIITWQLLSTFNVVPKFLLPSPIDVVNAFIKDFSLIIKHTKYTIIEAFSGLFLGTLFAFILSIIMDRFDFMYKTTMPMLIITQTIPTVAIAPLLVLWFGYGMSSKILLVIITTFFPITVALLDGYRSVDKESLILLKSMGANKLQEYVHVKLPSSLNYFFAGFRISVSYSLIGAVVAEWLGGFYGLGVYMTRVRKSYSFDKMFAVIFFISALSLFLITLVSKLEKYIVKWEEK